MPIPIIIMRSFISQFSMLRIFFMSTKRPETLRVPTRFVSSCASFFRIRIAAFSIRFSGSEGMTKQPTLVVVVLAFLRIPSITPLAYPMEHHIERIRSFGRSLDATLSDAEQDKRPRASVLVPLFEHAGEEDGGKMRTHVLLTKRPENLKSHPGQVCFPGGRQEAGDKGDDVLTALRETKEEVGVEHGRIDPICKWKSIESVNGLCVTPVVARIKPPFDIHSDLALCPREVEAAFAVPLEYFANDENVAECKEIDWKGSKFTMRTYYYTCSSSGREFKIWGLTAGIIHHVAQVAYGEHASSGTK